MQIRAEFSYGLVARIIGGNITRKRVGQLVAQVTTPDMHRGTRRGYASLEQVLALTGLTVEQLRELDIEDDDDLELEAAEA